MKVLRNQFPLVKGLQNCLLIPTRSDTNGKRTWNYDTRKHFTYIDYGGQIHFDGVNHWFASVKLMGDNTI